jgi:hypothetical protein
MVKSSIVKPFSERSSRSRLTRSMARSVVIRSPIQPSLRAVELGPARRPQRLHQFEHLIGTLAAPVEGLPHQGELFLAPADADAQLQPTTGQICRCGNGFRG